MTYTEQKSAQLNSLKIKGVFEEQNVIPTRKNKKSRRTVILNNYCGGFCRIFGKVQIEYLGLVKFKRLI